MLVHAIVMGIQFIVAMVTVRTATAIVGTAMTAIVLTATAIVHMATTAIVPTATAIAHMAMTALVIIATATVYMAAMVTVDMAMVIAGMIIGRICLYQLDLNSC